MSPPPPPLPLPSFLERGPGSDPEVRAWVAAAHGTISALRAELLAATTRAEAAERRLGEIVGTPSGQDGLSPPVDGQARLQAAADAAAAVIAEARVVLREVRQGGSAAPGLPPQGPSLPRTASTPPSPPEAASSVPDPPRDSAPESTPPSPAAPPVPATPTGPESLTPPPPPPPGAPVQGSSVEPLAAPPTERAEARSEDSDRRIAVSRPPKLDAGSSTKPPSAEPDRRPKPLLARLLDRRRRR